MHKNTDMKSLNSGMAAFAGYIFAISSVILYIFLFLNYSLNMPFSDDYGAILQFIELFSQAGSLHEKIVALFGQHNAHIVLVYRLVFVVQYLLFGKVNFLIPVYFGNILWLALVFIVFKSLQTKHVFYLGMACLLIFNWQYYIASVWGTLLFYTLFFAVCSFVLIQKESRIAFFCSLLCAVFAVFNAGNGILVPLLLVAYFVAQRKFCLRFWITLFFSITVLALYFMLFFAVPLGQKGYVKAGMMMQVVQYGYIFLTSNLYGMYELPEISTAILFSLLGVAVYAYCIFFIIRRKYYVSNQTLVLLLFFIVGTAFLTALGRVGFGIFQAASFRYRMLPSLFSGVLLLMYFDAEDFGQTKKKPIIWVLAAVSCAINISSLITFKEHAESFKSAGVSGAFLFDNGIASSELPYFNDSKVPAQILKRSVEKGFFYIPKYSIQDVDVWQEDTVEVKLNEESQTTLRSEVRVSSLSQSYVYVSVRKKGERPYSLYLAVANVSDTLLFKLVPQTIKQQYVYNDCYGILLDIEKYKTDYSQVLLVEQHFSDSRKLAVGEI